MKINSNRGVTLSLLVITVIVMLILFGITFSTATELLKDSQKGKMKTMLYMVQARAEILLEDYLFDYDGEDLLNISDADIEKTLGGKYITNVNDLKIIDFQNNAIPSRDKMIYCSWTESVLMSQGIDTKNLAQGDTIIVQYNITDNKVDVASAKGFYDDNQAKIIHFLSEFK